MRKLDSALEACARNAFPQTCCGGFWVNGRDRKLFVQAMHIPDEGTIKDGMCRVSVEDFHGVRVHSQKPTKRGACLGAILGGVFGVVLGAIVGAVIGSPLTIACNDDGFSKHLIWGLIGGAGGMVIGALAIGLLGLIIGAVVSRYEHSLIKAEDIFESFTDYEHKKSEKRLYCTINCNCD